MAKHIKVIEGHDPAVMQAEASALRAKDPSIEIQLKHKEPEPDKKPVDKPAGKKEA